MVAQKKRGTIYTGVFFRTNRLESAFAKSLGGCSCYHRLASLGGKHGTIQIPCQKACGGGFASAARTVEEIGVSDLIQQQSVGQRAHHMLLSHNLSEGRRSIFPI